MQNDVRLNASACAILNSSGLKIHPEYLFRIGAALTVRE
jgi:hypothetical protein